MGLFDWFMRLGFTLLCSGFVVGLVGAAAESDRVMFGAFIVLISGIALIMSALLVMVWSRAD